MFHAPRITQQATEPMQRCVAPELLDELPPADPRAVRARRDLKRVNTLMGHARIMARALPSASDGNDSRRIVELGAGDGSFLLRVARRLGAGWRGTRALLLDRLSIVAPETRRRFEAQDWNVELLPADAVAWLASPDACCCDAMIANLFLHHFSEAQLRAILAGAARRTRVFVALEPRRSGRSLFFSRLLWLVGCGHVTRYDACISVRAGFAGRELARLWPEGDDWVRDERDVGSFSHLFIARRQE